jgi:hypothetical protein
MGQLRSKGDKLKMFDFFAFVIFIFVFFFLVYKNIKLRLKISSVTLELIKAHLDKTIVSEKLTELQEINKNRSNLDQEAFLKFISDSRDWAYQYIDDVQSSLNKFVSDVEPEILYFDTYGDLMGAEPNYNAMKKISGAYKELKKLLPEDYDRIE